MRVAVFATTLSHYSRAAHAAKIAKIPQQEADSSEFFVNSKPYRGLRIAGEKMDGGTVGLKGVSEVATVFSWVVGIRGDFAERYREVQFRSDQLKPESLVSLAYLVLPRE